MSLEELYDGGGEGERAGPCLHLLSGQLVLHHALRQVAYYLRARGHLHTDMELVFMVHTSVADPPDPRAFGPPRCGSISQRYGSGSGSFYLQAKIVRKTLISTVLLLLFDFSPLKNDVKVPSKSNM